MTVSATTTYNEATGAGGVKVFYFTFRCDDSSWVKVYRGGVLQSSGYTVVLNADQSASPGGSVTFATAPDGQDVLLQRETPKTQATEYAAYDAFPAATHELQLDKTMVALQDTARDATNALAVETAARTTADLAEAAARAAADQAIINAGVEVALSGDSFVTATGSTTARQLKDRFADTVNALDFGCVGDGVANGWNLPTGTDNTAALQAAIDYALEHHKPKVYLPAGKYLITDTIHLGYGVSTYSSVVLEGDGAFVENATEIWPYNDDRPAFNIQGGRQSGLRRIAINSWGFPSPYPYTEGPKHASDAANYTMVDGGGVGWTDKTDAKAPHCGVCIDGYAGTEPANPYPTFTYPAFLGGGTSTYECLTSSDVIIEDCWILGTYIGVMASPNTDFSNGDFISLRGTRFQNLRSGVAMGGSQSRSTDFSRTNFFNVHTAIDGTNFGFGHANLAGNHNNIHIDHTYQIYSANLDWSQPWHTINFYGENMGKLGYFYGAKAQVKWTGCSFGMNGSDSWTGDKEFVEGLVNSGAGRLMRFEACNFDGRRLWYAFPGGTPKFKNCQFRTAWSLYADQTYNAVEELVARMFGGVLLEPNDGDDGAIFENCSVPYSMNVYQEYSSMDHLRSFVHSKGAFAGFPAYLGVQGKLGGLINPAFLSNRVASGRGFTADTTQTFFQAGDVIRYGPMWYAETVTDIGGGTFRIQWNAMWDYDTDDGVNFTVPDFTADGSQMPYWPIGRNTATYPNAFFKTTAGSPLVQYVDETGAVETPWFDETRRILWSGKYMENCGMEQVKALAPFPSGNPTISSIAGSVITMDQNASKTATWLDCPGLCMVEDRGSEVMKTAAATAIADKANAINLVGKVAGRTVFDTTNGRVMVATDSTDVSPWKSADGATTVTPS